MKEAKPTPETLPYSLLPAEVERHRKLDCANYGKCLNEMVKIENQQATVRHKYKKIQVQSWSCKWCKAYQQQVPDIEEHIRRDGNESYLYHTLDAIEERTNATQNPQEEAEQEEEQWAETFRGDLGKR